MILLPSCSPPNWALLAPKPECSMGIAGFGVMLNLVLLLPTMTSDLRDVLSY